ncbi:hypothetical protein NOF04DRAFT_1335016 [Fusarium oxysporum II5]|nr:hypothetical protein NOF04DRAFT_1335016 [Fusarium oxysporum II5]
MDLHTIQGFSPFWFIFLTQAMLQFESVGADNPLGKYFISRSLSRLYGKARRRRGTIIIIFRIRNGNRKRVTIAASVNYAKITPHRAPSMSIL